MKTFYKSHFRKFITSINASPTTNVWQLIVPFPPVFLFISNFTPSRVLSRPNLHHEYHYQDEFASQSIKQTYCLIEPDRPILFLINSHKSDGIIPFE